MKKWKDYSNYLSVGEWHIHTNFTDGKSTIDDYCKKAEKEGIPLLAFTEHVSKKISYDFGFYLDEIKRVRGLYDIIILSGCEVKVLPNGELNIDSELLKLVDYPIFAFHSFPNDKDLYLDCLYEIIKKEPVCTWAHPGLFIQKKSIEIDETELNSIFKLIKEKQVLLEINNKYSLPLLDWLKYINKYQIEIVRGSDCHHVDELCNIKIYDHYIWKFI